MKGHMQDGKFHPHTEYKGIRKSRDQKDKNKGIRMQRVPKTELAIPDLRMTKSYWKVVLENPREESGTTTHIIELGKMANNDDVINALMRMQKDGHFMYFPQDLRSPNLHSIERLRRDDFDDEKQEIIPDHELGDIVMVSPENDNEGYDDFRGKKLRITHVATNRVEHRGFDEGVGQALYDLETLGGQEIGSSLYDYELVSV